MVDELATTAAAVSFVVVAAAAVEISTYVYLLDLVVNARCVDDRRGDLVNQSPTRNHLHLELKLATGRLFLSSLSSL